LACAARELPLQLDNMAANFARNFRRWRDPLIAFGLAACLAGTTGCERNDGGAAARHVVLISLDTTRPDHLGCYGNPWIDTPNLDAFAGQSVVFDKMLTAAPTTLASHTSLFTGGE
jgi:hypothetical protein